MISHKYKAIFIHIPKCAGTSIESAFNHFDGEPYLKAQDHRTIREFEPIKLSSYFSQENREQIKRKRKFLKRKQPNKNNLLTVTNEQWESYFKFTIVRNPWARIESSYRGFMRNKERLKNRGIKDDLSFEEFCMTFLLKDNLTLPQTFWLKRFDGSIGVDKVIKFHDLISETEKFFLDYGFPSNNLPHMLNHKKRDYRESYNEKTKKLVFDSYKEEIELFGFEFDDEAQKGQLYNLRAISYTSLMISNSIIGLMFYICS